MMSDKITLEPFNLQNANLVLSWRNAAHVRANSLDDRLIGWDAHLAFLDKIAADECQHFFVVQIGGIPQAVLNISRKNDNLIHWGCYLGASGLRPGLFPMLFLIAGHLAFDLMTALLLTSDVLKHNIAPQKMNAFLGIVESGFRQQARASGEMLDVVEYALTRTAWPEAQAKALRILTQANRAAYTEFMQRQVLIPTH